MYMGGSGGLQRPSLGRGVGGPLSEEKPKGFVRAARPPDTPGLGEHHDGSFKVYMNHKKSKLDLQAPEAKSTLFAGVRAYVNGYTRPSLNELRAILGSHSGVVVQYWSRKSDLTHVIAENLPANKIDEMKKARDPTPVVSPAWVVDSIKQGRRLSEVPYILPALRPQPLFPGGAPATVPPRPRPRLRAAAAPPAPRLRQQQQQLVPPVLVPRPPRARPPPSTPRRVPSTMPPPPVPAPPRPKLRPVGVHSTETDPDFLKNFLSSSRLHFIGSWRTHALKVVAQERARAATRAATGRAATVASVEAPPDGSQPRVIVHVDMDAFFCSVSLLDHPELREVPVAVAHCGNTHGEPATSEFRGGEISSCNYAARELGIKAGMFMGAAKQMCPQLAVLPYNFERIKAMSATVYRILCQFTLRVQPMSCDEAYLDLTGVGPQTPQQLVSDLRAQIFKETGCTASAGIGPSMLMARLATMKAKPNGMRTLSFEEGVTFLGTLPVGQLPGVGWKTRKLLKSRSVTTVQQLRAVPKLTLLAWCPGSVGEKLWRTANGYCDRQLDLSDPSNSHQKSVGVEVSWGVRMKTQAQVEVFLQQLADEAAKRLARGGSAIDDEDEGFEDVAAVALRARCVTIKAMKRKPSNGKQYKHLGHGPCDTFSKSVTVTRAIADAKDIGRHVVALYRKFGIEPEDVRGLGVHMSKLVKPEDVDKAPTIAGLLRKANTAGAVEVVEASPPSSVAPSGVAPSAAPPSSVAPPPPSMPPPPLPPPHAMRAYRTEVLALSQASLSPPSPSVPQPGGALRRYREEIAASRRAEADPAPAAAPEAEARLTEADVLPSFSQIDPEVRSAVPEHLLQLYKEERSAFAPSAPPAPERRFTERDVLPTFSQIDPDVRSALPQDLLAAYARERASSSGRLSRVAPPPAPPPAPPSSRKRRGADAGVLDSLPPDVAEQAKQSVYFPDHIGLTQLKRAKQPRLSRWGFPGPVEEPSGGRVASAEVEPVVAPPPVAYDVEAFAPEASATLVPALVQWWSAVPAPAPAHSQLMAVYTTWLVSSQQVDVLTAVLKAMRRAQAVHPGWAPTFKAVADEAQARVEAAFGYRLSCT